MSHLEDALRYISAVAETDNYIDSWNRLMFSPRQPQEGLIEVLVKLKIVGRGVGALGTNGFMIRRAGGLNYDLGAAMYRAFMENK